MKDSRDSQGDERLLDKPITRRALLGGMALGGAAVALGTAAPASASIASKSFFVRRPALSKMIGFSQPDTTASIWQPLMLGAKQEATKRGYTLLESHANSELDAQLSEIETWIAEGVAGIIVLPLDNNAIEPLVLKAHKAGIKMLDYSDNALPHVDGWVIFDNLQGAQLVGTYAGQWVNKTLGRQGRSGSPDPPDTTDRPPADRRRRRGPAEGRAGRQGRRVT